jgi:hypothetical protein
MWLAGLGAAVVTRDWAQNEAGPVFRRFVKQGTIVESKAMRFVGDRVETSFAKANSVWKSTRQNVTSVVREYADSAVALVKQTLPRTLPMIELPAARKAKATAKKVRGAKRTAKLRNVRKAKRSNKRA